MGNPYYKYSQYLKNKYGVKTYKLTVNLPLSCPNRDGNLGEGGCHYCGEEAANFVTPDRSMSVRKQMLVMKDRVTRKYGARKFIAYFQNYTNTYLPLEKLSENVKAAIGVEDVVEVALATRPDCINSGYMKHLKKILGDINLTMEIGLQTINYHTLSKINRGHGLAEFLDAILTAQKYNIEITVHLILNLPGDNRDDVRENARVLSALNIDTVKLHALYIKENTKFAELYQQGKIDLITREEYIERVILFLQHLKPSIAVQRLLGSAPGDKCLFVNWGQNWQIIHNDIIKTMQKRGIKQGDRFDYLQGKALKIFRNKT